MVFRTWPFTLILLALIGLLALGCQGSTEILNPVSSDGVRQAEEIQLPLTCGDATEVALIAGQQYDAGSVKVLNDGDNIYVLFTTTGGWMLTETHVAVATSLEGIPQTKTGNPKVGNFPYKMSHVPPVTEYLYTISRGDYAPCTGLIVAAHAVVKKFGADGRVLDEQTAWGEGEGFPGKNWAMYFDYMLQSCCSEFPSLPTDLVTAQFFNPGPTSYWQTVLSNVPDGYSVADGPYLGWCVEQDHYIYSGSIHNVRLYSSYDPGMPSYALDPDWDMVNYIINHKNPNATLYDIQDAIWYFIDGGNYPAGAYGQAMVEDSLANGEGFRPTLCEGEVIAVILDPDSNTLGLRSQLTFIEVTCIE